MTPLNSNLNYEPPQEVIRLWKNTYSSPTNYDGVVLPGLIKTNYYYLHLIGFVLVLIGEFYGWYIVSSKSTSYDYIFIILLLIDLLLILPILKLNGIVKLTKNKYQITTKEFDKQKLSRKKKNTILLLLLLKVILFAIAFIKIYNLFDVYYDAFDAKSFSIVISNGVSKKNLWPLCAIYFVVAIIHSFFSSYFIGHTFLAIKINQGEKNGENIQRHRTIILPANQNFHEAETRAGTNNHYLTKKTLSNVSGTITLADDTNPDTRNSFKLHTWGLLTDKQLDELIWAQELPTLKRELSLIGLQHQLALMGE